MPNQFVWYYLKQDAMVFIDKELQTYACNRKDECLIPLR